MVREPVALLVPLRVSGQHKIWKLNSKTAAMARQGLSAQQSLRKPSAAGSGSPVAARQPPPVRRGDVGVVEDLRRVELLPRRPPPCAATTLPHSSDGTDQPLTRLEVLQGGMAVVRAVSTATVCPSRLATRLSDAGCCRQQFLSPREQQLIVNEVARLGLGEGGWYQPSYGNRGKQRLWMMNMGWRACITARLGLTAAATSDSRPVVAANRLEPAVAALRGKAPRLRQRNAARHPAVADGGL